MARDNGGIIGVTNNPTSSTATGVWSIESQYQARVGDTWPQRALFTTKSLRFNPASSDYLNRTPSSVGNRRTATFSCWFKRSLITSAQTLFWAGSDNSNYQTFPRFLANDKIVVAEINSGSTTWEIFTNRQFRDVGAWYHIVVALDTTQSTAANRVKIYVNGVQETSLNIDGGYPGQNRDTLINTAVPHQIGHDYVAQYYGGYTAESILIDGQALTPTSFGETNSDSGIWIPKTITGLTFGTNGYYLKNANAGALGTDSSGQSNNLTVNNLTSIDQSSDSPSNNFATMNPLDNFYYNGVFSEGNLKIINGSGREAGATSTIALSSGKWFWEAKPKSNVAPVIGIQPAPSAANTSSSPSMQVNGFGYLKTGKVETSNGSGGSTVLASYATYAADNIIGVALDLDSSQAKIYFYKNGALQGSGVNITSASATTNGHYFVGFGVLGGQDTFEINFGSPPYANSSGNADSSGFGNFEYAVPTGYLSLCTNNLNLLG